MNCIAFVDDEQAILDGLRRALRKHREEWDMYFFRSGADLLEALTAKNFDIVFSDVLLPDMSGVELLEEVREKAPGTIRIALSGYSNEELTLESVHPTHQFLAKPIDAKRIGLCIEQALALKDTIKSLEHRDLFGSIGVLPALPAIYEELMTEISHAETSSLRLGKIIASDAGLSATVLKMVNSAYFGLVRHIDSIQQAVSILGADTIKNLTLLTKVFSSVSVSDTQRSELEQLNRIGQRVGVVSTKCARLTNLSDSEKDHCGIAGMMINLGELIALSCSARACLDESEDALQTNIVGSYVLGIWAMPKPVVDAVRYYQFPSECTAFAPCLSPLLVVHLAWAMVAMFDAGDEFTLGHPLIDEAYVEEAISAEEVQRWFAEGRELLAARQER